MGGDRLLIRHNLSINDSTSDVFNKDNDTFLLVSLYNLCRLCFNCSNMRDQYN